MFSVPRPQYSVNTPISSKLDGLLNGRLSTVNESKILDELRATERGPAKQTTGYFERAVTVGASTVLLPILIGAGTAAFFAAKSLIRRSVS
jgi:hypothetical protein